MKNILLSLLGLFLFNSLSAQIETKIIGEWSVVSIESNKDSRLNTEEERQMKRLKKAKLEFTADGHAKFKQIFSSFNIPDGYWYYHEQKDAIFITEWDNRKVDLMRIWYDELDNGNFQFYLDGTPFVLEVTRE